MQSSNSYLNGENSKEPKEPKEPKGNSKEPKKVHADQKYIIALKENDYKLIKEIYQLHSDMIYRMVKINSGTETDAKDVFQEGIITLHQYALDDFKLTCPLKSFLYTICKRRWLNVLNRNSRHPKVNVTSIEDLQLLKEAESTFELIDLKEKQYEFCKRCFNILGPSCKNILNLCWTKSGLGKFLSKKEIAEELGNSYGYVRGKFSKCIKILIDIAHKDPDFDFFRSL